MYFVLELISLLLSSKPEQTIYRILDSNDVPRRPKVRGVRKIFVTIEEDVAAILDKEQSVSLYVNEAIRFYHGNRHYLKIKRLLRINFRGRLFFLSYKIKVSLIIG